MENQDVLNQFIINIKLVEPVEKIITGLNGSEYRDCDIKWLDSKLDSFVKFAAETLGIKGIFNNDLQVSNFTILNNQNKQYYITKFNTLLQYFKSF